MNYHSKVFLFVVFAFLLITAAGAGYFFYNYQASKAEIAKLKEKEKPQKTTTQQEIQEVSTKVGALMDLPKDEEPTLATVTDIQKLKNQQFFIKAANGDKVLIFTKAGKAILYRPAEDKIIEVASVNIGERQPRTDTPKLKVVLYNGTPVKGATETVNKTLAQKVTNLEIVGQENAKKKDYKKTIVVDVTGKQKQAATALSQVLGASVASLPKGETPPQNADLLVIYGK